MANNETTTKFKVDISQLKSAMQQAVKEVKLANAQFRAASAGMDDWEHSTDGLTAKLKQLNTVETAQQKQLSILKEQLRLTADQYGENSNAANDLRIRVENQKAALANTQKEIKEYSQKLEEAEKDTDALGDESKETKVQIEGLSDGFTVAKGVLTNFITDGIRNCINALKDLATETVKVGISFEQSMSKVKAISGATTEETELLTEKAKQMGETTVFSASEAADAFRYMAMAGWKTEDMLEGIEGIMHLAAASGEDLATTSDIVTDALTAFGMSAKESGRLADILAAASSNSNTTVSMLGESFKYVAPLAGSMGLSAEDVATALGVMANSGVKATMAGTSLRTLLTNMANPTDKMATAMDDLGISLTNSDGSMKSLRDIMKELRKGFQGLGKSQEDYEKALSLLNDELEDGTITQKQYDEALDDWINKTFTAEEALQAQTASMLAGKNGLSGLMALVNSSDEDFDKLTSAIDNSAGAASNMAETMTDNVGGQLTLLKSKVEGIMINVFDGAKDSIRDALDTISKALDDIDWKSVSDSIGKIAKKAAEFLKWVIKNSDVIIEIIKSIVKVMGTLWAVKKVSQFAGAVNNVIGAVKGFAAAMKGVKAASDIASASTGIFANLVSPGGAIVLGITAIVAVTATLINAFKEEKKEIDVLTEAQKESIQASHDMYNAYNEMDQARTEAVGAVQNEYSYYQELLKEFDSIVGANGKVKEGYEDRAQFIMTTLNEALGMEMTMQDGIIENYAKERQAIDDLIEKKKAEAALVALEASYTEAIQKKTEAAQVYLKAQETFNDVMAAAEAQAVKVNEANIEYARIMKEDGVEAALDYMYSQQSVFDTYKQLEVEVTKTRTALHEATDAYEGYNQTIENYEGLSSAVISGDTEKINDALLKSTNNMKTHTNTTADVLKRQAETFDQNYDRLKKAVEKGDKSVTQQMVNDAKKLADEAYKEYLLSGTQSVAGYQTGLQENTHYAEEAARNMGYGSYEEFEDSLYDDGVIKTKTSGENFANGFINAVKNAYDRVYNVAHGMADQATKAVKDAQDEHSPSKVTALSGKNFTRGYMNGIEALSPDLLKVVRELVEDAVGELDGGSMLDAVRMTANGIAGGVSTPVSFGGLGDVKQAVNQSSIGGIAANTGGKTVSNVYNFTQNNTSPKALSRLEIYRQTKNQLNFAKGVR